MKRTTLLVVLMVLLPYSLKAQSLDLPVDLTAHESYSLRIAQDSWTSPDKRDHFIGGMGTMALTSYLFDVDTDTEIVNMAGWNILFWGLWEVKDSMLPWERYGWWGGDGFSGRDFVWSAAGVAAMTAVVLVVK